MAITAAPNPRDLSWSDFNVVSSLPGNEDAHIDMKYDIPEKDFRKVDGLWRMAETFEIAVSPVAKILDGTNKTAKLLSHEQGHYDIGILVGHAMARDFEALATSTPQALVDAIKNKFKLHRITRMKPIQEKYDEDTKHSLDQAEQDRWDEMIRKCLAAQPTCSRLDGMAL